MFSPDVESKEDAAMVTPGSLEVTPESSTLFRESAGLRILDLIEQSGYPY